MRIRRGVWMACWLAGCLCLPPSAAAQGRHLSLLIDTSGSMKNSDPPRYTLQLSQILADLLDTGDSLTVTRLPAHESSCADGPDPGLSVQMDSADRGGFQARLDKLLYYDTGNNFAAPVHTAQADLQAHREKARLLLFIADSGGLGKCDAPLTADLLALRQEGVMVAAINMGGPGAFDSNPAFAFTVGARDSADLAKSVALVYQKFIGAKQVQTGRLDEAVEFELDAMVRDAFLVVAADGPLNALETAPGNPAAEQIDLNHKGGGHAIGLDRRQRDYRIVRLHRPQAGHWRFLYHGPKQAAGWMLLQDSAMALRLASPARIALNQDAPLAVELYDQDSGKRLEKPPGGSLQVSAEMEGHTVELHDDGKDGDLKAGDGMFTANARFGQEGVQRIRLNLQSQSLDRHSEAEIQVEKVDWRLRAEAPPRAEIDAPATLSAEVQAGPGGLPPRPLPAIEVYSGGQAVATLHDDGRDGDAQAGDGRYGGMWTPAKSGEQTLEFRPPDGQVQPASVRVQVIGVIRFGRPLPVNLGRTGGRSQLQSQLELGADTVVKGEFPLELRSDFDASASVLEIDLGQGWVALGSRPQALRLTQDGPRRWPLRLRVNDCPAAVAAAEAHAIEFTGTDASGRAVRLSVPLAVEVVADPWLHCWWPVLAALAAALLAGFIIHGFRSPSRFSPKLGVVLSPEEDMNEGFFHPIRAQRGTGSGFYRDARVYIRPDFCLSGNAKGELARLRADGKHVRIRPAAGCSLLKQNFEGEWEALPNEETTAHFGVLYKDALGGLYFEIRNG